MREFVPFPDSYDIEPDGAVPVFVVKEMSKRKPSGNSAKRREYVRPDASDIEARALWAAEPAPTSSARVAEELSRWFGATCTLCGGAIDMTLTGIHPARWNVDHLIPKASGGQHVWGNLQLAHRACNGQKAHLALPEPPPWLYDQLLRSSVSRFENNGIHVPSEIELLRERATIRIGVWDQSRKLLEEGLISSEDFFLVRQKARAVNDIALVTELQARLITAHDESAGKS